jgi:hypothetical protein
MANNEKTNPDGPSAPRPDPQPLPPDDDYPEPPFDPNDWCDDPDYNPYVLPPIPPIPLDPNDLDFLDAALAGITQWRNYFVYGVDGNKKQLEHYTNCALYIRAAYYSYYGWLIRAYRGLRLFNVPLAEKPDCTSKRDVIRLMGWFEDAFTQRDKALSWAGQERDEIRRGVSRVSKPTVEATAPKAAVRTDTEQHHPKCKGETPVRIQTAIEKLNVSHSRVKQAAKKEEIHSQRAGAKKNSPYLVFKSEVEHKFGAHGAK